MSEGIIGVVGGVGPYAGLDLVKKIFDQTIAKTDQEHLSVCLISESNKIQDRTAYLRGEISENPGYAIANILKKLEKAGANVATIACNTAHSPQIYNVVIEELKRENSKLQLLHIAEETIKFIKENFPQINKVGILGTKGTIEANLYGAIIEREGLEAINPEDKMQDLVHSAIYDPEYGIKAISSPVTNRAKEDVFKVAKHLQSLGAQGILLGCTELPLALKGKNIGKTYIFDPTLILARALIKAVVPEKLKPYFSSED